MVFKKIKQLAIRAGVFALIMGVWEYYIKPVFHMDNVYGYVIAYFTLFIFAYGFAWWVTRKM